MQNIVKIYSQTPQRDNTLELFFHIKPSNQFIPSIRSVCIYFSNEEKKDREREREREREMVFPGSNEALLPSGDDFKFSRFSQQLQNKSKKAVRRDI